MISCTEATRALHEMQLRRQRHDDGACAWTARDQAILGEQAQRLAHGVAAGSIGLHQLRLRGQAPAQLVAAVSDLLAQRLRDLPVAHVGLPVRLIIRRAARVPARTILPGCARKAPNRHPKDTPWSSV
jgi:hypothetical protein